MNIYKFIAAVIFELGLASFAIWGMVRRDKFDALIDRIEAFIKKVADACRKRTTAAKVKKAKQWLREAEIDEIISPKEKRQIVLEYLHEGHMIVLPVPGVSSGKNE